MRSELEASSVRIVEVGPRDGLQNEAVPVSIEGKVEFIERLAQTGVTEIEFGSFVSPRWVPQLADAEAVAARLPKSEGLVFTALVPNEKGLERARKSGVRSIAVFTAASETFNQMNINASIDESFDRFAPVLETASAEGIRVRGYVSTAFACPFEGVIDPAASVRVIQRLFALGVEEVSVGDTIGVATPNEVDCFLDAADGLVDPARLAFHFHDTRGTALVNVLTAIERGVRTFDSAAGGLGGCPYAPGAGGNLATEELLYFLDRMGIETGIELDKVVEASRAIELEIGHPLPSRVYRAVLGERTRGEASWSLESGS